MPIDVADDLNKLRDEDLSWPRPKRAAYFSNHRYIGYISGRYTLASRQTHRSKRTSVFACRIQSISPKMAVVIAPVIGRSGEQVTANFDHVGLVRGTIIRFIDGGFVLAIEASEEERKRLGTRIDWLRRKTQLCLLDQREHKRHLPRNPRSVLTLASGKSIPCFIIDMSLSGVAVSADTVLRGGTPLAVGHIVGRVVRQLDLGFAIDFLSPQKAADLERLLAPPGGAAKAAD